MKKIGKREEKERKKRGKIKKKKGSEKRKEKREGKEGGLPKLPELGLGRHLYKGRLPWNPPLFALGILVFIDAWLEKVM